MQWIMLTSLPAGSDPSRNSILDLGGHSQAGEARNRAGLCSSRMCYNGEDAEVWRGREDRGKACGRGREQTREDRPPGE